jgi:predicted PurR-regulated permease PerM
VSPGGLSTTPGAPPGAGIRAALDRRSEWVEAFVVLATLAVGFVVLGYLASYFQDYFRLILMFFLAWLLAFLVSPVADWLQRRLHRLPRPIAVLAVIVPIIVIVALIAVRAVIAIAESFAHLVTELPDIIADPPTWLADIQAWLDAQGIAVDVVGSFESIATQLLTGMADLAVNLVTGAVASVGTIIDAIIVVSLAVFMAIDKDRIMRTGLDLTPPERREDVLLFRRKVGSAFAGFIRSQVILGALYGVWALLVSFIFGLPFAVATAFLAAVIMAIPIYGPYVSWLPPVLVAFLFAPDLTLIVAVAMLIGWFIDENILAPLVRADTLELHPIVVTLAFLLGAELAGAIGAVVAIPLAAVVQAFVTKYLEQYREVRGWPGPEDDLEQERVSPASPGTPATGEAPSG